MAFAALDTIWTNKPTEGLAALLGAMAINSDDRRSMDPAALSQWNQIERALPDAIEIELVQVFLRLNVGVSAAVPNERSALVEALDRDGSDERSMFEPVIRVWVDSPESFALDAPPAMEQSI